MFESLFSSVLFCSFFFYRNAVFGTISLCFFVCVRHLGNLSLSRELLNGFAPNSHGRCVWSLTWTSLKVKVRGQRSRQSGTKKRHFGPFGGLQFMFGKTSLVSSLFGIFVYLFQRRVIIFRFSCRSHSGPRWSVLTMAGSGGRRRLVQKSRGGR